MSRSISFSCSCALIWLHPCRRCSGRARASGRRLSALFAASIHQAPTMARRAYPGDPRHIGNLGPRATPAIPSLWVQFGPGPGVVGPPPPKGVRRHGRPNPATGAPEPRYQFGSFCILGNGETFLWHAVGKACMCTCIAAYWWLAPAPNQLPLPDCEGGYIRSSPLRNICAALAYAACACGWLPHPAPPMNIGA